MVYARLLQPLGIDFPVFYEAAWMWMHGQNPYLTLLTSPGPFNYPPTAIVFLGWLGLLPFQTAAVIWNVGSVAAFMVALYLVGKMVFRDWSRGKFVVAAFLLMIPFFPEKFTVGNGQINNFTLLLSVLFMWWYRQKRWWPSAAALALAVGIKLTPMVYLIPLVLARDWRQVARVTAMMAGYVVITAMVIPWTQLQPYFTDIFFTGFGLAGKDVYYNQSLLAFLARTVPETLVPGLYIVLALGLVGYSVWRGRKLDFLTNCAVATCLYLMLHPLTWQHHLVFAVIPFMVLVKNQLWWAGLGYLLVGANIKQPAGIHPVLASHAFWGVIILWRRLFS